MKTTKNSFFEISIDIFQKYKLPSSNLIKGGTTTEKEEEEEDIFGEEQ